MCRTASAISRSVANGPTGAARKRSSSNGGSTGSRKLRAVSRIEAAENPAPIANAAMVT